MQFSQRIKAGGGIGWFAEFKVSLLMRMILVCVSKFDLYQIEE